MSRDSEVTTKMLRAYEKGCRVTDNGDPMYPNGEYMRARLCPGRYLVVAMNGMFYVHRLAAYQKYGEAMFGKGIEVRHLNGCRTDNSLSNIAIGTRRQNTMDIPREIRLKMGRAAGLRRKVPDEIKARIAADWEMGMTRKQLREKYRICLHYIGRIVRLIKT